MQFFGTAASTFDEVAKMEICKEFCRGVVKCRIVYRESIESMAFEHYVMRSIRSVTLVECGGIDYSYKYEDRSALNKLFEKRGECSDILIVKNGLITDISYANVVFRDFLGGLYTPFQPLLEGTKRASLLSKGVIFEREIKASDIYSYEGFYVINAMIDIEDNNFIKTDNIF